MRGNSKSHDDDNVQCSPTIFLLKLV